MLTADYHVLVGHLSAIGHMLSHRHLRSKERLSASFNLGLPGQAQHYLLGKGAGQRLDLASLTQADMLERKRKPKRHIATRIWCGQTVLLE